MAFGQQPQGNNAQNNGFNNQYQYNQQYNQYNAQPQYAYAPNGTAAVNVQATYSYEQAERSSVNSAYTHMTLGLIVTAVVAIITQMSGAYLALIQTTGIIGIFAPAVIEIVLAIYLGARIHTMKVSTAYVMFYVYAALMGFTLSTIFMAYDLGTIGISLALCAGFFFALTMFGRTTKINMLKAGPILFRRPHRAYHRRSDSHDLRPRQHHPHDRLCHRTSALRRHDRLRRPSHPRHA